MNKSNETNKTIQHHSKIAALLANTALAFSTSTANSHCAYIYHQSKVPDEIKTLRKF